MLPVALAEEQVSVLMRRAVEIEGYEVTVDLEHKLISDTHGFSVSFDIGDFQRYCLLEGLDDIGLTLKHENDIARFETQRPAWMNPR